MPPGIPVATVGLDGARNAGILAAQILATGDKNIYAKCVQFKKELKEKIVKANEDLKEYSFKFRVN
jgi:5-(carboxyamino)imidazole ribonucleotide mutase